MGYLRQSSRDLVSNIQHSIATIREARAGRINVGKRSGGVAATDYPERNLIACDALNLPDFIEQARVCPGLQRIQAIELSRIRHVIEQRDRRKFGVDRSVTSVGGCCMTHYHNPPRKASIRRKVSYRAT